MLAIARKRRGEIEKKFKVGTLGGVTLKVGEEESVTGAGIYVWLPIPKFPLELVFML